jgi:hypothetical protein
MGKEWRLWNRGGRWEGGRGWYTITSSTKVSSGRRGPCYTCFVSVVGMVVQVVQIKSGNTEDHRSSQCHFQLSIHHLPR